MTGSTRTSSAPGVPEEVALGLWRLALPMGEESFLRTVNAYLLRSGDGYVLVDTGPDRRDAWLALQGQLDELGVPITGIHTLVITHGHPDHVGLAAALQRETGARVWLHQLDVAFQRSRHPTDPETRAVLSSWYVRYGFPLAETEQLLRSPRASAQTPTGFAELRVDRHLLGGEVLDLDARQLEIRWMPGHTPGHVCLYDSERRILLGGDHVLQRVAPNVGLQPGTESNPLPPYLRSLDELDQLHVDTVLPGHGGPFRNLRLRTEELRQHQYARRDQLLALLEKPMTPYELAGLIWAETEPNNWAVFTGYVRRNAVATLVAHLELLATEGRIARIGGRDHEPVHYAPRGAGLAPAPRR